VDPVEGLLRLGSWGTGTSSLEEEVVERRGVGAGFLVSARSGLGALFASASPLGKTVLSMVSSF